MNRAFGDIECPRATTAPKEAIGSLCSLCWAAGNWFKICERDASSSLRLTRNSDLKRISVFCTKPQESPKAPSQTYSHRVPLHKPVDWERKILIWSGRLKKEDEILETVCFESWMLPRTRSTWRSAM